MLIGAFLIARMDSSRLHGKCMIKICDKPLMELLVERVKSSRLIDRIIIATTSNLSDASLEDLAKKLNVSCYRGSPENVMERICNAAKESECEIIVELLGDNPLVHSDLIDDVITFYKNGNYDYAATITKEYPLSDSSLNLFSIGIRVQVYSRSAAEQWINYKNYLKNENKHPCSFIFEHPEDFKIGYLEAKGKWEFMNRPNLTFAVNYRKNIQLIQAIFNNNYIVDKNFSLKRVYAQLDKEKSLYNFMGRP